MGIDNRKLNKAVLDKINHPMETTGLAKQISELIDLKIELYNFQRNPPKSRFWDPEIIPPSFIEENLRKKEEEIKLKIQQKEKGVQDTVHELETRCSNARGR